MVGDRRIGMQQRLPIHLLKRHVARDFAWAHGQPPNAPSAALLWISENAVHLDGDAARQRTRADREAGVTPASPNTDTIRSEAPWRLRGGG